MMEQFIPDMYQKSIYSIDYLKLKEKGIKCILMDLDNTMVPLSVIEPTKKIKQLFEELKEMGFKVIIFSNAKRYRLESFKKALNVDCCAFACKPRRDKYLKIMNEFNYEQSEVACIGDQLYTDVLGGNRVGITTILVNPVSKHDQFFTRIVRKFEAKLMHKLNRLGFFTKGKYYD